MAIAHAPDSVRLETVSGAPLFILTSLSAGEKHGHALMKDIESFASVRLGPGTLYKAMARLERLGFIEALDPEARRRPYGITPAGVEMLERSLEYLGQVIDEGKQRLALAVPIATGHAGSVEASRLAT